MANSILGTSDSSETLFELFSWETIWERETLRTPSRKFLEPFPGKFLEPYQGFQDGSRLCVSGNRKTGVAGVERAKRKMIQNEFRCRQEPYYTLLWGIWILSTMGSYGRVLSKSMRRSFRLPCQEWIVKWLQRDQLKSYCSHSGNDGLD